MNKSEFIKLEVIRIVANRIPVGVEDQVLEVAKRYYQYIVEPEKPQPQIKKR